MLEELRITGLGVIEESVLPLHPGLTVITGETGAGKTMLITALGLLLGGRADSGAVRRGSPVARVEGLVRIPHGDPETGLAAQVEQLGGLVEDGEVIVTRQLAATGRSRAFVGGAAVPVARLATFGDALVTVHGQSDQQRLTRPETQRTALDAFAGEPVERATRAYAAAYTAWTAARAELENLRERSRDRAREADLLRFGLAEVEDVDPQAGEEHALAAEESRLGNAETLRTAAEGARSALSADDEAPDALGAVASARQHLDAAGVHDPEAADLAARLATVSYELADVAADVAAYATSLDVDPARLAHVSERRAAVVGLLRKYGETTEEVLAWSGRAAARLLELDDSDERVTQLVERVAALETETLAAATTLREARADSAPVLAAQVQTELAGLAMPDARVEVTVRGEITPDRLAPHGACTVEILLAPNPGAEPRPLGKGASGGELSRVMLALEVCIAGTHPVPTFVFDEVDAGVGGRSAVEIGARLARLARHAQVVVVTHLPQVAAFADSHVVVAKTSDGSVTRSGLTTLAEDDRVRELSRMLAGLEESDTALAHAEELLAHARRESTTH
ncbi:DNA repair protein RecN [Nocardioidaceae bacterium]|nr:DNA repair protein RecN [Nocardioidaceae bacterium]